MIKYILIFLFVVITLTSCAEMQNTWKESRNKQVLRTIIIDGDTYQESSPREFKSLSCRDFIHEGKILLVIGQISPSVIPGLGFILFDGSNIGTAAFYSRKGLTRVWSWGKKGEYRIIIYPNGKGAYFDFTGVPDGETVNSKEIYKCKEE